MKAIIQRVTKASVTINNSQKRNIGKGVVIFLGIYEQDTKNDTIWLSDKILNLRIFPNESGKFDKSILDIKGDILIISQFTLYGDCRKGRRPDFTMAAKPQKAIPLYKDFIERVSNSGLNVQTGEFGANMLVEIYNDGPVTFILESPSKECTQ